MTDDIGKVYICPRCGSRELKEELDLVFGDTYYLCLSCLRVFFEEPEYEEVYLDMHPDAPFEIERGVVA